MHLDPAGVQSTYAAVCETACLAARGDTTRSYGFLTVRTVNLTCTTAGAEAYNRPLTFRHARVQERCVSCGWKPLRISLPHSSFDSTTGSVFVVLKGTFVRTVSYHL